MCTSKHTSSTVKDILVGMAPRGFCNFIGLSRNLNTCTLQEVQESQVVPWYKNTFVPLVLPTYLTQLSWFTW
jgi:hypothetical protein